MQQEAFCKNLASLRRERGMSQREVAEVLQISQALLSHYENGAREPGLAFVCRACDYYGVSADYLLGRTDEREDTHLKTLVMHLQQLAEEAESYIQ